jgi:hypothetical protein
MHVLELFAGSRSIGKAAMKQGLNNFSVDVKDFGGITLVKDVEELQPSDIPVIPDMIWAGIPCTSWSIAGISHHRRNGIEPISDFAHKSDRLLAKTLELINHYLELNPNLVWYIENPVGCLRKMPQMMGLPRATVNYCKYGDSRMKPTDIWSNNIYSLMNPDGWMPRPQCKNGNPHCHHQRAPRGSRTGTQGLKNNHERSKMPTELCDEIIVNLLTKNGCEVD